MEFKSATLEEGLGLEKIKFDDSSVHTNKLIKEILKSRDQEGKMSENVVLEKMQALFALPELDKVIFVSHNMDLRHTEFNPQGLLSFMKANFLSIKNEQDIVFAIIMVKLLSLNILEVTSLHLYTQATATDIPDVVSSIMDKYASHARTMMVVALHAYSLGNDVPSPSPAKDFDTIPWYTWYKSFTKVRGSYLNQKRFELIVKLIASSHFISKVIQLLTLDEILSGNNVLKYKMSWRSSPSLVIKALKAAMPHPELLEWFEPGKIMEYTMFEEAGVIAQIASGPLSKFCKGEIDSLSVKSWPPETTINYLKPIRAPHYVRTIIRAKMLDVIGFNCGRWHQAAKAMANHIIFSDIIFKAKAEALLSKVKENSASGNNEKVSE